MFDKQSKFKLLLAKLKRQAIKYLIQDSHPNSYILYWVLFQSILNIRLANNLCSAFLIFSIIGTILSKRNYFFIYGPLLNLKFQLTLVNYAFGLFASNQKSKVYLYSFFCSQLIAFYLPLYFVDIYRVTTALIILQSIWKCFIFQGNQNKNWFCVFSTYCFLLITKYILISIDYDPMIILWLSPFSIFLGHLIFTARQKQILQNKDIAANSPQSAYFYIQLHKQKLQNPAYSCLLFQEHKRQCSDILCACHDGKQFQTRSKQVYVDNLYRFFLERNNQDWQFLYNKAIINKIDNSKILQAIYMHLALKSETTSVFRKIQRARNQALISKIITKLDSILADKNALTQALLLDRHFTFIHQKIVHIVRTKIKFWKEVAKPISSLQDMQMYGIEMIDKIQALHVFFTQKVEKLEEYLNSYSITILYAMYIMSVTNNKDYADSLIKSVKRKFEIHLTENPVAELQVVTIKNKDALINTNCSMIRSKKDRLSIDVNLKNTLYISNVSNSFCRLLQKHKQQLIGINIQELIPPVYRPDHYRAVQNLFHSKYQTQSKVLGRTRQFPLYLGANQNLLITMHIKILFDQNGQFLFLAVIEPPIRQFKLILTNFKGQNLSSEPYADERILKSKQLLNQLSLYQEQWLTNRIITPKVIFVRFHKMAYLIKFHSPSQERYKAYIDGPPLHVEVKNQTQTTQMNYIQNINENQVNYCFDRIKNVYNDQQTQATVKTKRVENSMCRYKSCQAARLFRPLYIFQLMLFVVCIITSNMQTFIAVSDQQSNGKSLLDNFEILINIDQSFKNVQLLSYDYHAALDGKVSKQFIKLVYGEFDFNKLILLSLKKQYTQLDSMMNEIVNFEGNIKQKVDSIMNKKLNISYNDLTYSLTIKSIVKISTTDIFLLANNFQKNINQSTLEYLYYPKAQPQIKNIIMTFIDDFFQNYIYLLIYNLSVMIGSLILMSVLMIPICKFRNRHFQRKLKIYQLLTSIESKLIKVQINLLANVQYTLLQSRNSPEFVKTHSICRIGKTQRHLTLKQNENAINYKLQMNEDGDNQTFQLRKKNGEILIRKQTSISQRVKIKIIICWVLFLLLLFFVATANKIYINYKAYEIQKYIYDSYHYLNLQEQIMLITKIIANKTENNNNQQFIKQKYQVGIDILDQLQKINTIYDQAMIQCNQEFQSAMICSKPMDVETANNIFIALIQSVFNIVSLETQPGQQSISKIVFFGQSVLTAIAQTSLQNIQRLINQKKELIKELKSLMNYLYIVEWIWIILTLLIGVYITRRMVNKYIKQTKIILLVTEEMFLKTKLIQSYLDKFSKS